MDEEIHLEIHLVTQLSQHTIFLSVSTGLCWFIFSLFRLYKAASEIYHHIAASLGKKKRRKKKEGVFKSAIW